MLSTLLLLFAPAQLADPVRTAEMIQKAEVRVAQQRVLAQRAMQAEEQKRFLARFNNLVFAIEVFARRYNEGHGTVWPQREAEQLRKAMREVQQSEKALGR